MKSCVKHWVIMALLYMGGAAFSCTKSSKRGAVLANKKVGNKQNINKSCQNTPSNRKKSLQGMSAIKKESNQADSVKDFQDSSSTDSIARKPSKGILYTATTVAIDKLQAIQDKLQPSHASNNEDNQLYKQLKELIKEAENKKGIIIEGFERINSQVEDICTKVSCKEDKKKKKKKVCNSVVNTIHEEDSKDTLSNEIKDIQKSVKTTFKHLFEKEKEIDKILKKAKEAVRQVASNSKVEIEEKSQDMSEIYIDNSFLSNFQMKIEDKLFDALIQASSS